VVDDDEGIRRLIAFVLERQNFEVETAANGRLALQALLRQTFDVAVVDLRMQEMDGIAFIQEARKIWPWQGFVICSGHLDDRSRELARREGVEHMLAKPLDMDRLVQAISRETGRVDRLAATTSPRLPMNLISYQLGIMRHLTRDLLHDQSLTGALANLGRAIMEMLPCDLLGILGIEEEAEHALILTAVQPQPQPVVNALQQHILQRYQALSGQHLDARTLHVELHGPPPVDAADRPLRSIASVPILVGDTVRGILTLGAYREQAFDELNVALLYHAASNLSTLLTAIGEMRAQATRDALTGLDNRRRFDEELDRAQRLARRYRHPMAVIMIDMDQFKAVNDRWGHAVGDTLLVEFATLLRKSMRGSDALARYGGDEFAIILPRATAAETTILANRIADIVRNHRFLADRENPGITASLGAAVLTPDDVTSDFQTLVQRADHALYQAKSEGRDRGVVWAPPHPDETAPPTSVSSPPAANRARARLLVVDDEEYILLVLRQILAAQQYEVVVARTVSESIEQLRNGGRFDLLICDLSLPDGDGIEILRAARDVDRDLVNIVLSGNVTAENVLQSLRQGAYDFIQKPVIAESLLALVTRALQYRNLKRENARYREYLEDMVRATNSDLTKALDDIKQAYQFALETMVAMLDAREFETGQHSVRVRALTLHLARTMGFAGDELEEIGRGALLHDIGKIGIPDAVLLKPGRLTEDEWAVMRKHPEIGYRFLKNSAFLQTAAGIVLSHHEHYDGSGYPQGLKGEAINPGARIFAVIDAYDAMRSSRVYKESISREKAVEEINACSGSQFDPLVVESFLSCVDELERIGGWSQSFT
jgi:diguanylate cyclase (GGDEF)-like protein/putative nucleotidyltransferase with HDIG domain